MDFPHGLSTTFQSSELMPPSYSPSGMNITSDPQRQSQKESRASAMTGLERLVKRRKKTVKSRKKPKPPLQLAILVASWCYFIIFSILMCIFFYRQLWHIQIEKTDVFEETAATKTGSIQPFGQTLHPGRPELPSAHPTGGRSADPTAGVFDDPHLEVGICDGHIGGQLQPGTKLKTKACRLWTKIR